MKKIFFVLIFILCSFCVFAEKSYSVTSVEFPFAEYEICQNSERKYALMPIVSEQAQAAFVRNVDSDFPVNTSFEVRYKIPKSMNKGLRPEKILGQLDLMSYEVCYFDVPKNRYVPIFYECKFNEKNETFVIRDKNFGRMFCRTKTYISRENGNNCGVMATLSRPLANPLFFEIKKNEFNIFVMTCDSESDLEEDLDVYMLIQTSYKINKLFRAHIENAFNARIIGMMNWFVRMYTVGPDFER